MSVEQQCICIECNGNIKKGGAVQCTLCYKWCHQKCANLNKDEMKLIDHNAKLGYFCGSCQDSDDSVPSSPMTNNNEIKKLSKEVKAGFEEMNKSFKCMIDQMNTTLCMKISELRSDIDICNKNNKFTAFKVSQLEIDNNVLHKRLNRSDVVVTGVPHSNNIKGIVKNLCSLLEVSIDDHDIQLCCFLNKKDKILIKFNSVEKKDLLMQNYFKYGNLKLCELEKADIIEVDADVRSPGSNQNDKESNKSKKNISDINSRVYLNDNLTPLERKLSYFCRKLKKNNKILKFQLMHNDIPKVKIVTSDGTNKYLTIWECYEEFGETTQQT